jgi:hypothetical protein
LKTDVTGAWFVDVEMQQWIEILVWHITMPYGEEESIPLPLAKNLSFSPTQFHVRLAPYNRKSKLENWICRF